MKETKADAEFPPAGSFRIS